MSRLGSCKGLVNVLVFNFTEPQDAMFALALARMFSRLRFPPIILLSPSSLHLESQYQK
jgi:hypothetical protein